MELDRILLVGPGDTGCAGAPRENGAADGLAGAWVWTPKQPSRWRMPSSLILRRRLTASPWRCCSIESLGRPARRKMWTVCAIALPQSKRACRRWPACQRSCSRRRAWRCASRRHFSWRQKLYTSRSLQLRNRPKPMPLAPKPRPLALLRIVKSGPN